MLNAKPLGIIDTLNEGFVSLNRHLWVLLIPIALDLLLAFGPGVTSTSIVESLLQQAATTLSQEAVGESSAALPQSFSDNRGGWLQANLFAALAMHLPSAVTATSLTPKVNGPVLADISAWPVWFAVLGALVIAAIGLASVYLTALAGCVRANPAGVGGLLGASGGAFGRLLVLYGMIVFVGVPISLVLMALVALIGLAAPVMASLLGTLLMAAFMLGAFYATFSWEALVLNGLWPVPAVMLSAKVVFRHFWSALGFIVLSLVITTGIPVVWRVFAEHPAGLVAAIVGHAYVSSGLAVAAMLFFWQRQSLALTQDSGA